MDTAGVAPEQRRHEEEPGQELRQPPLARLLGRRAAADGGLDDGEQRGARLAAATGLTLLILPIVYELFDSVGMDALRDRSLRLTGYLRAMLESRPGRRYEIITPEDDASHGCQLSIIVEGDATDAFSTIEAAGVVADFRPPNVVRVAPTPMYNTFLDCWQFAMLMGDRFGIPAA